MSGGAEGEQLGSYRLVQKLGRGGMGEVWLAEHDTIKSQVAIKLVLGRDDDADAAARFLREAKATARIRHPGIVAVSDYGARPGGGAYLVMELLDGESLAERLQRGRLETELAIDLGVQIAEALGAAHATGVIHRDLKPGNVFLVRDAATRTGVRAKLLDFGVAKPTQPATGELATTATGALVGTPLYMAPEQWSSRKGSVDQRSDVYALGVMLYEMTSGTPPFTGPALGDLLEQHASVTPAPLRQVAPHVPAKLEALVMRMLAKARDDRPGSAHDVVRALRELRGDSQDAIADTMPPPRSETDPFRRVDPIGDTIGTERNLPSGGQPVVTAIAPSKVAAPVTDAAKTARTRPRWLVPVIAASALVAAAIVVGVVVLRGDPALDVKRATDAQLDRACEAGNARACVERSDRELAAAAKPDLSRVFTRYLRACDRKDDEACTRVAEMLVAGSGVRPDDKRARALVEAACERKHGRACDVLASLYASGIGGPQDNTQAIATWRRGCELGNASACHSEGRRLMTALTVARDDARSQEALKRALSTGEAACNAKDAEGCYVVGLIYFRGGPVAADPQRGAANLQRACDLGAHGACGDLGELHAIGMGVAKDPDRAGKLLQSACDHGDTRTCEKLALATGCGLVGPADPAKALAIAQRLCENSDRFCSTVGNFYAIGVGTTQDFKVAQTHFERACRAGHGDSCASAADRLLKAAPDDPNAWQLVERACSLNATLACLKIGKRAAKAGDYATALRWFENVCNASEHEAGCGELAGLYFDGKGVERDPARGRAILERCCQLNVQFPCLALGERLRDGNGMPAAPGEALPIFLKVCELGLGKGCLSAADLLSKPELGLATDDKRAAELRAKACTLESRLCGK